MLLSTAEALQLLVIEDAFLAEGRQSVLFELGDTARLLQVLQEGINHVVFLIMKVLCSEKRRRRNLGDVNNDVKELAKVDCEFLIQDVFDCLFWLPQVVGRLTHGAAKRDQFVEIESHIDDDP